MAGSHKEILAKARKQLADVFEQSGQSVYIYLDDINKACNARFATLLGYDSPSEWASVKANFPEVFVSSKDREVLVSAYQDAVNGFVGTTMSIRWKKKKGGEVPTKTILVPMVLEGHRMALHFITPS